MGNIPGFPPTSTTLAVPIANIHFNQWLMNMKNLTKPTTFEVHYCHSLDTYVLRSKFYTGQNFTHTFWISPVLQSQASGGVCVSYTQYNIVKLKSFVKKHSMDHMYKLLLTLHSTASVG